VRALIKFKITFIVFQNRGTNFYEKWVRIELFRSHWGPFSLIEIRFFVKNFNYNYLDASKFDDDPWPIRTNNYELPISINQIDEAVACQTFRDLRNIFKSRMIFGTAEKNNRNEDKWQTAKFSSINNHEVSRSGLKIVSGMLP